MSEQTLAQALNGALATALESDERIVLLGEDIGRTGGVFRISDGLRAKYGEDRVFDTPVAESGIIGAAFGRIVSALVDNVLMPPIGFLLRGVDFKDLAINLGTAQTPVLIRYGAFLQTLIDFAIIAFVLFLVIKGMIALKRRFEKEEAAAPPKPTQSEVYLKEIRDALVKK